MIEQSTVNSQQSTVSKIRSWILLNKKDFWLKIRMVQNYDWDDGHHFCNSNNFNIRDGKILIVDYASSKTQRVILKHGQNIIRHFSVL